MKRATVILVLLIAFGCGRNNQTESYQGYVEGEFISAASISSGHIETLAVSQGDRVLTGSLLFSLDSEYEQAGLKQAVKMAESAEARLKDSLLGKRPQEIEVIKSQLAQATAQAKRSALAFQRDDEQFKSGAITKAKYDDTKAQADADAAFVAQIKHQLDVAMLSSREDIIRSLSADLESAKARVEQAKWSLNQRRMLAEDNGTVYEVMYHKGELVPAGAPVLRILPDGALKIRFFVPELSVPLLNINQQVFIEYGGEKTTARVTYVSKEAEFTPPIIYSNETKHKLIFMAEALPDDPAGLLVGQPVVVTLK